MVTEFCISPRAFKQSEFYRRDFKIYWRDIFKKFQDKTVVVSEYDQNKIKKNAINMIMTYYRIMSYRSFYKKVLGEKIREKVITGNKIKVSS